MTDFSEFDIETFTVRELAQDFAEREDTDLDFCPTCGRTWGRCDCNDMGHPCEAA